MGGAIRLGKNHLRWCRRCNLPILESKGCPVCGGPTDEVVLTPPGDARPAFPGDVAAVRALLDADYGEGSGEAVLPEGRLVLLSKAPALDRMDEVVVDGVVVASVRYDMGVGWKAVLRMQGAYRLKGATRHWVLCDPGAVEHVRESKNLMAPGVLDADPGIEEGDEVVVLTPGREVVSTGMARMSGPRMVSESRGVAVKTRWYRPEEERPAGAPHTWDDMVEANRGAVGKRVDEAVGFIRNMVGGNDLPAVVSFSGGKDSLCTLLLTLDAGLRLPVLFVDTGLELPETVEHVHDVCERHGLELIEEKAPADAFFGNLVYFGPPAKDFRWCCKTNKLGPTVAAINRNFPDGVLSFIGQRRYESEARRAKSRVWRNPWTPGQLGASPIQNWCAMHVWTYIFMKGEPFNVWYTRGLDRIGCFLCPASDLAEFGVIAGRSGRWAQWDGYLDRYMEDHGLPPEWKEFGLWRWKDAPRSVREEVSKVTGREVSELTRRTRSPERGPLAMRVQEGYSPCTLGYSVEAALSRPIDLEEVAPFCHALAWQVEADPEGGYVNAGFTTIYAEGAIIAKAAVELDARRNIDQAFQAVVRAEQCVGCGLCAARCGAGALYMEDGRVRIHEDDCVFCRQCFGPCPSVDFAKDEEAFERWSNST